MLSGGVANFSTAGLAAGSHQITANYSGSADFSSSASSITQQVDPPPPTDTTTAPTSSLNPAPLGATVKFTATVTPTPTVGTVQFAIDGTPTGNARALSGGVATLSASNLAAGSHQITASYSGSTNFTPSAAAITQLVDPPAAADTTTTLTSSRNPAPFAAT